jgi:hypothetical protein
MPDKKLEDLQKEFEQEQTKSNENKDLGVSINKEIL